MWKRILTYYSLAVLLLLGVIWRISTTQGEESVIPGLDRVSAPILWGVVAVLSVAYLLVGYRRVKKTMGEGRKKEAAAQGIAFLFNVVLFVCFWLI